MSQKYFTKDNYHEIRDILEVAHKLSHEDVSERAFAHLFDLDPSQVYTSFSLGSEEYQPFFPQIREKILCADTFPKLNDCGLKDLYKKAEQLGDSEVMRVVQDNIIRNENVWLARDMLCESKNESFRDKFLSTYCREHNADEYKDGLKRIMQS